MRGRCYMVQQAQGHKNQINNASHLSDEENLQLTSFFRVSTIDLRLKRCVCMVFFSMRLAISTYHLVFEREAARIAVSGSDEEHHSYSPSARNSKK